MKNCGQDFLNRLEDLVHDQVDDERGNLNVKQFRLSKELLEEEFVEWLWGKFIKDVGHV